MADTKLGVLWAEKIVEKDGKKFIILEVRTVPKRDGTSFDVVNGDSIKAYVNLSKKGNPYLNVVEDNYQKQVKDNQGVEATESALTTDQQFAAEKTEIDPLDLPF